MTKHINCPQWEEIDRKETPEPIRQTDREIEVIDYRPFIYSGSVSLWIHFFQGQEQRSVEVIDYKLFEIIHKQKHIGDYELSRTVAHPITRFVEIHKDRQKPNGDFTTESKTFRVDGFLRENAYSFIYDLLKEVLNLISKGEKDGIFEEGEEVKLIQELL